MLKRWQLTASMAFCSLALGFALWAHSGIPAYRHDWQWPPLSAMLAHSLPARLAAWNWNGLGAPNLALQVHPFFVLTAGLASVCSPKAILIGCMVVYACMAASGATVLSMRLLQATPDGALVAGVLYALAPLVVNELVAGHVEVLLAYAAVPWAIAASLSSQRSAALLLGSALAWTTLHIQYLLFAVVLIAIVGKVRVNRLTAGPLACAAVVALLGLWSVLNEHAQTVEAQMRTSLPWVVVQSADPIDAMRAVGYFARYWETAAAHLPLQWLYPWIYPAAVLAAAAVRRGPTTLRLLAAYAVGFLVLSGTKGPAAPAFSWLFSHSLGASALRELYHGAIFVVLPGSVAAAWALSALRWRPMRLALAAAVAALAAAPFFTGSALGQTGSITRQDVEASAASFEHAGAARFFLRPGVNPMGPVSFDFGGADPLAFSVGEGMPFSVYSASGGDAATVFTLERAFVGSAEITKALGIGLILDRKGFETKFSPNVPFGHAFKIRELPGEAPLPAGWRVIHADAASRISVSPSPASIVRLLKAPTGRGDKREVVSFDVIHGSDIGRAWAPAQDFWYLALPAAIAAADGALTFARDAAVGVQCIPGVRTADVYRWEISQPPASSGSLGWHLQRPPCGATLRSASRAPTLTILTAASALQGWRELVALGRREEATLKNVSRSPSAVSATSAEDCRRCEVVLAERCDAGWALSVDGQTVPRRGEPCLFDTLNVWSVSLKPGARLLVRYGPQRIASFLEVAAAAAWFYLLACAVGLALQARRDAIIADRPSDTPSRR
ncbi:MAG: hypothetical protein DLM53_10800 [Candidatus Eremiobacter antarcticus]|nr:MAG: hypothetical protein DLM53_10800 [Candidatus Eremiobacter sp. RRmetagenome_bin22]